MLGYKDEDTLGFATFTNVDSSNTLKVRNGLASDECVSEWAVYISGCMSREDMIEESGTSRLGEE